MYIKRIEIKNFRNFADFDVELWESAVIVGENNAGKSNLLYALRLVLDQTLPDSDRVLEASDFWDGLDAPFAGNEISIAVTFADFRGNSAEHASVPKCFTEGGEVSTIRYVFRPENQSVERERLNQDHYDWSFWCGNTKITDRKFQKFIPFELLPVFRNVGLDLENANRSPLYRLIKRLNIDKGDLQAIAAEIDTLTKKILASPVIKELDETIKGRYLEMVGSHVAVDPSLGMLETDRDKLLRFIRIFSDQGLRRAVSDIGTGYSNIVYIVLLLIDFQQRKKSNPHEERLATSILGVEEPEAHLHPHLQRLVFSDFFKETETKLPVLMTTHSPHIASVAPLKSLLRLQRSDSGTTGHTILKAGLSQSEIEDIQRFLDVTRSELMFSSGVILVEGIAEGYIVTEFAKLLNNGLPIDTKGISVVNIQGIHFGSYLKLLHKNGLSIPTVVITDGDPDSNTFQRTGLNRCAKLSKILNEGIAVEVESDQRALGLFVGENTLEIDMVDSGYQSEIIEVFQGFDDVTSDRITRLEELFRDWNTLKPTEKRENFLVHLKAIDGKGRFAQRLVQKLSANRMPEYIRAALGYLGIS